MINRRDFLKSMIGTGISSIMPTHILAGITLHPDDRKQSAASVEYEQMPKGRRIYYSANNMELYMKIYRCASGIDCEIFSINPYAVDMMSLNGFIYIIDRNFSGIEWWNHYVRCCNKYNWLEPFLVIDNVKDMEMPKSNYVRQFDLNDPSSISLMLYIIKEALAQTISRRFWKLG
jgi:hypothetical protein